MGISSLYFTDVGPFEEITLEFDEQVNVFTGPNNSGKSTVLWVLGELLVYPIAIPLKFLRSDHATWKLMYSTNGHVQERQGNIPSEVQSLQDMFTEIGYTCFIPAQRHSSGVRPTGTSLDLGQSRPLLTQMWRGLSRSRPAFARETWASKTLRRQGMRHHGFCLRIPALREAEKRFAQLPNDGFGRSCDPKDSGSRLRCLPEETAGD